MEDAGIQTGAPSTGLEVLGLGLRAQRRQDHRVSGTAWPTVGARFNDNRFNRLTLNLRRGLDNRDAAA